MSTHQTQVVTISADDTISHPNADTLNILTVGGWSVVYKRDMFPVGSKAVYLVPDTMVPVTDPLFMGLRATHEDKYHRIKARSIRGVTSYGLLTQYDPDKHTWEQMGLQRYEPQLSGSGDLAELPYSDTHRKLLTLPIYDLENILDHPQAFAAHETVIVTEKIHGTHARYCFIDGVFYCGSRRRWLKKGADHWWSRMVNNHPGIYDFCVCNPGMVLYGEIFGPVQSLKYGRKKLDFRTFGVLDINQEPYSWLDIQKVALPYLYGVYQVPVIATGAFNLAECKVFAEGDSSLYDGQMREGVVITSTKPDRLSYKLISDRYWHGD